MVNTSGDEIREGKTRWQRNGWMALGFIEKRQPGNDGAERGRASQSSGCNVGEMEHANKRLKKVQEQGKTAVK